VSGATDVSTKVDNLYTNAGYTITSYAIPIGVSCDVFYEWAGGLALGVNFGPCEFQEVTGFGAPSAEFLIVPLGVDVRYTFCSEGNVSPYVRGGLRCPIACGDLVSNSHPGFFGAFGVVFGRQNICGVGLEAAVDTSTVDLTYGSQTVTATPSGFMLSLFAEF
jgi:hypothetical protein